MILRLVIRHVSSSRPQPFKNKEYLFQFCEDIPQATRDNPPSSEMVTSPSPLDLSKEKLLVVAEKMGESIEIKTRVSLTGKVNDCFVGTEAVQWLLESSISPATTVQQGKQTLLRVFLSFLTTRNAIVHNSQYVAVEIGAAMSAAGYIRHASSKHPQPFQNKDHFYVFTERYRRAHESFEAVSSPRLHGRGRLSISPRSGSARCVKPSISHVHILRWDFFF